VGPAPQRHQGPRRHRRALAGFDSEGRRVRTLVRSMQQVAGGGPHDKYQESSQARTRPYTADEIGAVTPFSAASRLLATIPAGLFAPFSLNAAVIAVIPASPPSCIVSRALLGTSTIV